MQLPINANPVRSRPHRKRIGPGNDKVKESFNEISHAVTFIDHSVTSLRGDYSVDPARNLAHASSSLAAAGREISACFGPGELTQWKAVNLGWIYEDEEEDGVQEVGKRLTNLAGRSALTWRRSRFGTRGWSLCKVHNGYI